MKVTQESNSDRQAVLTIELEPHELESFLDRAYRRLVPRLKVPGFRQGKAPRPLLERFMGREAFLQEALKLLVPEVTQRAIQEQQLDPCMLPVTEVVSVEPLVLKTTVPLKPVVEVGDYRSLRLDQEPVEVSQEQVAAALEDLRQSQALWEPVDRPVRWGDLLSLDLEGRVEGKVVFRETNLSYVVDRDASMPFPDFPQQLQGMQKEETREFTTRIAQDYDDPSLAGRDCELRATVKEVKEKRVPELNDDFARSMAQGFDSLESLREHIYQNLMAAAERRARRRFEDRVVEALVEKAEIQIPPLLVEREIDQILAEEERALQACRLSMEDYLKRVGKSSEELREEVSLWAKERLRRSLVLSRVAELEGIQVSEEEVTQEVEALAREAQNPEEVRRLFNSDRGRDTLRRSILTRKTLERLTAIASGKFSEGGSP